MNNKQNFFSKVYEITRLIPFGRVTSYGAIAKYIGDPRSGRVVGWALNNCKYENEFIPAHRVVNRNGVLTGKHHFDSLNLMLQLLKNEGIDIKNDTIINFEKIFWDPSKELI